jgi:hypothetical protein
MAAHDLPLRLLLGVVVRHFLGRYFQIRIGHNVVASVHALRPWPLIDIANGRGMHARSILRMALQVVLLDETLALAFIL